MAAGSQAIPQAAQAAFRRQQSIQKNPFTNWLYNRYQQPLHAQANRLYDASTMARDAGSRMAANAYGRQADIRRQLFNSRNAALARFAESRAGRFAGGAVGLASQAAGLSTKAGQMMGMGRFAPLGGAAMVAGGIGYAGVSLGQLGNEGMPSRFSDITRFQFGADREAARQLKRDWNPANKKAPLGFIDRFLVEGRKANNGQATWLEKGVKFAGEQYQRKAAEMGASSASLLGTISNVAEVASPPWMMLMTLKRMFN
jgi:hypothetical protein